MSNPNRIIRSLQKGDDTDERKIMSSAAGTTAILPDPPATENGLCLQHAEMVHLYPVVTGAAPSYTLKVWYRSLISGEWHPSSGTTTISDDSIVQINTNGENYIYLQITAEAHVNDTIDMWAGYNTPSAS